MSLLFASYVVSASFRQNLTLVSLLCVSSTEVVVQTLLRLAVTVIVLKLDQLAAAPAALMVAGPSAAGDDSRDNCIPIRRTQP